MRKIFFIISIFISALSLSGQEVIWKITYDIGIPFSSTKEYTDQVSWRGIAFDVDRFINDNLAVGLGISWSTFLEKEPDSDYQRDDMLIHGTQVRYINNIPLLARISWYQPSGDFDTYFTVGVGTVWQDLRREIGLWAFGDDYWQFALSPEAGIIFPVGQTYITGKIRYMQGFKTSDAPGLSYMAFGLGIAF